MGREVSPTHMTHCYSFPKTFYTIHLKWGLSFVLKKVTVGEMIPHLIVLSYVPATGATWLDIHRVHLMALLLPIWWPLVFGSRKWQQLSKILPLKQNKTKPTTIQQACSPKLQGKSDRTRSQVPENTSKQMTAFSMLSVSVCSVSDTSITETLKGKTTKMKHNATFTFFFKTGKKEESPWMVSQKKKIHGWA